MSTISRRTALISAAGVASGLALSLAGCTERQSGPALVLAAGEPGGVYLSFGRLLSAAFAREDQRALRLRETHGSEENTTLLATNEADLALALADSAEVPGHELVALGRVYQNYLQCVVRADSAITRLDDLRGARVSIGARGSGCAITTRRLLETRGIGQNVAGTELREFPISDAIDELAAGRISALFWSGGLPTPLLTELDARIPLTLLDLAHALPDLAARYPERYLATRVPAGVYRGSSPTPTIGIPNYLLAQPSLPDAAAASLVGVLIDHAPELVPSGTVGVQFLTPASLIDTGEMRLHPAAAAEYRRRYG